MLVIFVTSCVYRVCVSVNGLGRVPQSVIGRWPGVWVALINCQQADLRIPVDCLPCCVLSGAGGSWMGTRAAETGRGLGRHITAQHHSAACRGPSWSVVSRRARRGLSWSIVARFGPCSAHTCGSHAERWPL